MNTNDYTITLDSDEMNFMFKMLAVTTRAAKECHKTDHLEMCKRIGTKMLPQLIKPGFDSSPLLPMAMRGQPTEN